MPPRALRWPLAPLWVALGVLVGAVSPLLEGIARLVTRLSGRPHALVVARLLVAYVVREAVVIVAFAGLWVRSGFGARLASDRFRARHYALLGWFVGGIVREARRTLRVEIEVDAEPEAAAALADPRRPLLVFSRHAGPGDSVLLVDMLLRAGRQPCIVMTETVALDPVVDLVARRLPTALLDPGDDDESCARIASLARQLDGREALLLFPEGGNFSPARRLRAIRSLRRRGSHERAARAELMPRMIAPRPGGVLAALDAAPGVDVLFTAHTGLGIAARGLELLRNLPVGRTLEVHLWHVPAAEIPRTDAEQVDWLDAWWGRLDGWVEGRRGE